MSMVNKRFGPPLMESPISELALLHREGLINDFAKRFLALSCRDTTIMNDHQVQLIIKGLGNPLHTDVALQCPTTIDGMVVLDHANKQCDVAPSPTRALPSASTCPPQRCWSRPPMPTTLPPPTTSSTASASSVVKPASNIRRLTPAENAQRRNDGQFFHCDEFFTNGHKLVCKQQFSIEVVDDEATEETPVDIADLTVSMHALTSIRPCSGKTMQMFILVNGTRLRPFLIPDQLTIS
jgi:hypothetical protein